MKRIIFFCALIFVVISICIGVYFKHSAQTGSPASGVLPTPSFNAHTLPLGSVQVGKTTQQEVEKIPDVTVKKILPDGNIEYDVDPARMARTSKLIIKNGIVIFKQDRLAENNTFQPQPTISQYKESLGAPEEELQGSIFYGPQAHYYIYASKGITIIGNPLTDEVFETQSYTPMSVNDYTNNYGNDILQGPQQRLYF